MMALPPPLLSTPQDSTRQIRTRPWAGNWKHPRDQERPRRKNKRTRISIWCFPLRSSLIFISRAPSGLWSILDFIFELSFSHCFLACFSSQGLPPPPHFDFMQLYSIAYLFWIFSFPFRFYRCAGNLFAFTLPRHCCNFIGWILHQFAFLLCCRFCFCPYQFAIRFSWHFIVKYNRMESPCNDSMLSLRKCLSFL